MPNLPSQADPSPPPRLTKWILVVDDEPSMRVLLQTVLRAHGWSVKIASGADEAMALLWGAGPPPSVAVCDVLMPKVDGLALVRRMVGRVPSLSIIFISGHLTDESWWPDDLRGHRFLGKPFDNAQLISAVADAMAGAGRPG